MAESSGRRVKRLATRRRVTSPPRQPSPPPPNPEHLGIEFRDDDHLAAFNMIKDRPIHIQKFADLDALDTLHVREGVQALFNSVGWGDLLHIQAPTSKRLTLEFLSSARFNSAGVRFRAMNRTVTIGPDSLAQAFGCPVNDVFAPAEYNGCDDSVWTTFTGETVYNKSNAKASKIIHPVLRVAHRILASIIQPREERSTVNSVEMVLLYSMVTSPVKRPHFGAYVLDRLKHLCTSSRVTSYYCGGLITLLCQKARIPLPPLDSDFFMPGSHLLTVEQYSTYRMFRAVAGGFLWTVGHTTFLVTPASSHVLSLAHPVTETDWLLNRIRNPSAGADAPPSQQEGHFSGDIPMPQHSTFEEGGPSTSTSDPFFTQYNPYHEQYMTQFQSLHSYCSDFNSRLSNVESHTQNHYSEWTEFRAEYRENQASTRQSIDNLTTLITGIRDWTINYPGYQPPPPPDM